MPNTATSIKTIRKLAYEESQNKKLVKSAERQAELGEVFTPTELVIEMLKKLPKAVWKDEQKTFLDPACGNGQFLAVVLIIKKQFRHKDPLSTIYGVDIMEDNVEECRERLLDIAGDTTNNRFHLERNIVCADGLKYDYEFDGSYVELKYKNGRIRKICVKVSDFNDEFKLITPLCLWGGNAGALMSYAEDYGGWYNWLDDYGKYQEDHVIWPTDRIVDFNNNDPTNVQ